MPLYIVEVTQGEDSFQITQFIPGSKIITKADFVKVDSLPKYEVLKNFTLLKLRRRVKDNFDLICLVMAVIILSLLVLDWLAVINITIQRIASIGAIIGLVLVPFSQRLKILGFEIERVKEEQPNV